MVAPLYGHRRAAKYFITGALPIMTHDELARIRNKEIGFVFQTFNLLARATSLHNVELPLIYSGAATEARLERAKLLLRHVDLEQRMHPISPANYPADSASALPSPGRWVQISILLADEPTGNLDTATGVEIMGLFERLHQQGNTIVLGARTSTISPCTPTASSTSATGKSGKRREIYPTDDRVTLALATSRPSGLAFPITTP